jgi:uncharacterized protein YeeX (DUF496 family)
MKATFELDYAQVDAIVIAELKSTYENMKKDYEKESGMRVFVNDIEEDRKKIMKYMKSLERIIKWYGGSV